MDDRVESCGRRFGAGRVALRADVLRNAKAFRRGSDFRCKQGLIDYASLRLALERWLLVSGRGRCWVGAFGVSGRGRCWVARVLR